jgi:hypothetical protein
MVVRALRSAAAARTPPRLVLTATRLADGLRRRGAHGVTGAVQVTTFSALATLRQNLATVTSALDRAAVPYDVLPAPAMRRPAVRVEPGHAEPARAALASDLGPGVRVTPSGTDAVRVFTEQAAGDLLLAGPELGVDVLLSGSAATGSDRSGGPGEPAVPFPVDAVYTRVDGTDPEWQARKEAAWSAAHPGQHSPLAANASRFASREELRYSLRSLEMYAGWVRHVFLVTDRQVPRWLRPDHPGLTVVDHREIFPAGGEGLPTFNSHAIEARLHHIPGLAEHYLYLNDDVFFGRPVGPELFFRASGESRYFETPSTIDDAPPSTADRPVEAAAKVSRGLVRRDFQQGGSMKFQHVAHPQRRDLMVDLEARFGPELDRTVRRPFRHPDDVSAAASLAHQVGAVTGQAVPGQLRYLYCDIAERRAPIKLHRLARERDVDMFCLNDVGPDPEVDRGSHDPERLVQDFLAGYFPLPSRFEAAQEATR